MPDSGSRYQEKYMVFFSRGIVAEGRQAGDESASTFYSALSNIDFRIEDGNPVAVAMRCHFAQHGFISHVLINIGSGRAGISEVGNELEDLIFLGGDYGITSGQTSPGWPIAVIDSYFEGQRKAAIQCSMTGYVLMNMHVKNVPVAVEIREKEIDRLYMENCLFDNIKDAAVIISKEENSLTQVNLLNIDCRNVPVLAKFRQSGKKIETTLKTYKVKEFTHGLVMDNMAANSEFRTISNIEPLQKFPLNLEKDIPALPSMDSWVNIKELGAKGDGTTDDTKIFQDAIDKYPVIYVPQGWYHITQTVKMKPGTKLIGLHPFATQFIIAESEPAFSGFGGPKPLLESSEGGDDILNGIGISTGGLYISNTSTPGKIYAISLEHHVRNEARFENISNWKMYAFQLEEESREGKECQMIDISN